MKTDVLDFLRSCHGFARWVWLLLAMGTLSALGACASINRYDDLQTLSPTPNKPSLPRAADNEAQQPARLGLVFGGGGVRGFMHLGVLRALDEAGIRADVVTGTSAGSVAAALYASGLSIEKMTALVRSVSENEVADLVVSTQGFIQGRALAHWINQATGNQRIEALRLPLGIAVTDLSHGESRLVVRGNLGEAVQASASIPGAFVPVMHQDSVWVDGGVLAMVPVRFARQLGADVVIAIDIYCGKALRIKDSAFNTTYNSVRLQGCKLSEAEIAEADVLIRPPFEPLEANNFKERDAAIEAGYQATKAAIPEILKRLGRI